MRQFKLRLLTLIALLGFSGLLPAKPVAPQLTPGPNDGNIAYITARLLEEFHYSQHPLDTEMSGKFFDTYLDAYDPQHVYFLQSDIDEFAPYRTNLAALTLSSHGEANVTPAFKVFNRFSERLHERVAYAEDLLKHDNFKFNSDEVVQLDRKNAPYPKTLDEAKQIWKQQVYWDYLREKLDLEDKPGETLAATNLATISQTLQRRYERELRTCDEWDSTDILQIYLDSLARAYDPHSDYLNYQHAQDFSITMSLALFGIGAELTAEDGYCKISSLVPGGPAAKSKEIKPDDKIVAVAQGKGASVDVVDMELGKIVQLIRGPKGTEVRLTIIPADDPKSRRVIKLVRDEINLKDEQAKAILIEKPDGNGGTNRLGIIDVPSFYAPVESTGKAPQSSNFVSTDVAALLKKLNEAKVNGIILDLRNNPGGSLEEAVQFVGLFVTNGPVVQIRSPDTDHTVPQGNDSAPDLYHGPMVVLINKFSASASEIVAAALQDYGRALVVGDTSSFGKGTVQNLNPLRPFVWPATEAATNDPGMVKITIRKFYRINGTTTQFKGVVPDIILPDALSYSDQIGESALPNALPWDTTSVADYTKLNEVQPYLTSLQKNSEARVATNQDFNYVRQDIAELQKLQAEKTDTLNERKAWDEKSKLDVAKKAREKEIFARPLPNETVYEISVADAAKPGLPLPTLLIKASDSTNSVAKDDSFKTPPATTMSPYASTNVWLPDPMMDESVRILKDYISLQPSKWNNVASHE
jgi:carboxyl-terminal processing protease